MRLSLPVKIILLLLFGNTVSKAQSNLYFEPVTHPGLLTTVARAVATDAEGRVYVGTNEGFYRYDGYKFDKYPVTGPDSLSCAIQSIRTLHYDGQYIWIGGVEGLAKLNTLTGRFTYFKPDAKEVEEGHHPVVNRITQIDNKLYLGTLKGFTIMDPATGKRKEVPLPKDTKSLYTYAFCKDSNGKIWIGSAQEGVFIYDPGAGQVTALEKYYKDVTPLPGKSILSILDKQDGSFWLGSKSGLISIDTRSGTWKQLDLFNAAGEKVLPEIRNMIKDDQGNIYIASFGEGLFFYDAITSTFTNYTYSERWARSLPDNNITYIAKGNNGIFWITAEDGGLTKLNTWFSRYNYILVPQFSQTKNSVEITDTYIRGADTWFTSTAGLIKYGADKKFTLFTPLAQKFEKDYCLLLSELDKDHLVFMIYDDAVSVFNVSTSKFGYLQPPGKAISGNTPVFDWLSFVDKENNLYVSTADGGYFRCNYKRGTIDTLFTAENIKLDYPIVIPEPDNSNLWIMATSKLYHYNIHEHKLTAIAQDKNGNELPPISFQEDVIANRNGIIYIASDEGFFIYDRYKNELKRFTDKEGLADNNCFSLFTDNNEQPYINYKGGLMRFNEQNNTFTAYPMPDLKAISSEMYFSSSDDLYLGMENGFIQVNKSKLTNYTGKPYLDIPQMHAGSKVFSREEIGLHKVIKIQYDDFPLVIDYLLTDHMNPEKNTVRYMLEAWDDTWITDDKRNFKAVYAHLTPGKYLFKIEGSDGLNKTAALSIAIEIIPPFWQTWWFITGCILIMAAGIYALYRYRLNQVLKLHAVRNKIASDLHDDVGSTLSSIRMYSDIVSNQVKDTHPQSTLLLDKISSNSKEMIENMSDIVWMIKPGNDDFKNIGDRMLNFANELCVPAGINFEFTKDNAVENIKISMEQRRDIYLIFKEAINNAVKYSGCGFIHASITVRDHQLQMQVSDDGNGFDINKTKNGNGLLNMQKRVATYKGNFAIQSVAGGGTEIVVLFHL